jgi:hypothetical protein
MTLHPGPIGGGSSGGSGVTLPIAQSDVTGLISALAAKDTPASLVTLASAAAVVSATVTTGQVFICVFEGLSNAASNTLFITFNADTAQTSHESYQNKNSAGSMVFSAASGSSSVVHTAVASGAHVSDTFIVTRVYDGTSTIIRAQTLFYQHGIGLMQAGIERSFSGDVPLTTIAIRSNQANGLKAGSYLAVKRFV